MLDTVNYTAHIETTDIDWFKFKKIRKNVYMCYYKKVLFNYFVESQTLLIKTNIHKILNKSDITTTDIKIYIKTLKSIIRQVLKISNFQLILSRLDYCIDLKLEHNELQEILKIIQKHRPKYKHMKMLHYKTGIGLYSKNGLGLILYDKGSESKSQFYKDTLRIEVRYHKNNLKALEHQIGLTRELENFATKDMMLDLCFEKVLKNFLYVSDYTSIENAYLKIEKSNYTNTIKKNLKKFLYTINVFGFQYATDNFAKNSIAKYISNLESLGVNPITTITSKNIKSLYIRALEKAENYYFI